MTESAITVEEKPSTSISGRNEHLVSVLGALIVLLGFVLNNGVRERTKDLSSALASAKSTIPLQERLISIQGDTQVTRKLLITQQRVVPDVKAVTPRIQFGFERDQIERDQFERDQIEKDRIYEALGRIHYDVTNSDISAATTNSKFRLIQDEMKYIRDKDDLLKGRVSMIMHISDDLTAHRGKANDALNAALKIPPYKNRENPEGISAVQKQADIALVESNNYSAGLGSFDDQVEQFSGQVQHEIYSKADREEATLRWLNYASYLLFFLGWALGPLAKARNRPALATTSE